MKRCYLRPAIQLARSTEIISIARNYKFEHKEKGLEECTEIGFTTLDTRDMQNISLDAQAIDGTLARVTITSS